MRVRSVRTVKARAAVLGVALVAVLVAVLGAAGCGSGSDDDGTASAEGGIDVATAFSPLAWAVELVGGDAVSVTNLTPPGAEPHDLELTPDQRDEIEDADLVVVLGNGFQSAVEEAAAQRSGETVVVFDELVSIDASGRPVEDAHDDDHDDDGEHADEDGDEEGTGHDDALDPHVWLDPVLMAEVVEVIEVALTQVAPDDAEVFAAGAERATAVLGDLDAEHASTLADCESRLLVSAHDAFGYLAARYGLEAHGVAGLSPDEEPSAARLAELADLVESEGVRIVFTEERVSPRIAETLAEEAGVDTEVLSTLESFSDEEGEAGEDYPSVMRSNLATIAAGLGCR